MSKMAARKQEADEAGRLKVEYRPLGELIPYARNSRTHSEAQVAQIAASIREFSFTNPVLIDEVGSIIAGHGRVLAARQLGLADVPCIVLRGLSELQKRAYVIADNKLALNAGWDTELLVLELQGLAAEGYDAALTGFGKDELDAMVRELSPDFAPTDEGDQGELDKLSPQVVTCPECGHEWDIKADKA